MRLADWFIEKLLDRLVPLFGGLFASRIEAAVILQEADHLDALEERARRFEDEGKPELAAALRARAAKVTPENPAGSAVLAIQNLQAEDERAAFPLLGSNLNGGPGTSPQGAAPAGQLRRPSGRKGPRSQQGL